MSHHLVVGPMENVSAFVGLAFGAWCHIDGGNGSSRINDGGIRHDGELYLDLKNFARILRELQMYATKFPSDDACIALETMIDTARSNFAFRYASLGTSTVCMYFATNTATKSSVAELSQRVDGLTVYVPNNDMVGGSTSDSSGHVNLKYASECKHKDMLWDTITGGDDRPRPSNASIKIFLPRSTTGASTATVWGILDADHLRRVCAVVSTIVAPVSTVGFTLITFNLRLWGKIYSAKMCEALRKNAIGAVIEINGGHKTKLTVADNSVTVMIFRGDGQRGKLKGHGGGAVTVTSKSPQIVTEIVTLIGDTVDAHAM